MAALNRTPAATIKIKAETHLKLQELSRAEARPMGEIVTRLVDEYERAQFWQEARASLDRLRADPVAWQDYQDEIALWDQMSGDGLENEEPYYTPEEEREILANA